MITFPETEAALVDAWHLWRRSPAVGHAPIRSAWPEFRRRAIEGDYDAAGGDRIADAPRPLPLTRDEVARRDRVSAWVEAIPGNLNRRIVWLAVAQIGARQLRSAPRHVSWRKVERTLGRKFNRGVLAGRYSRAIKAICFALNHPEAARMVRSGLDVRAIMAATGMTYHEAQAVHQTLKPAPPDGTARETGADEDEDDG